MQFLFILNNCVQSYWHLSEILAHFSMTTYRIWSKHVTKVARLQSFELSPAFASNFRRSHKILIVQKLSAEDLEGVGNAPPSPPVIIGI